MSTSRIRAASFSVDRTDRLEALADRVIQMAEDALAKAEIGKVQDALEILRRIDQLLPRAASDGASSYRHPPVHAFQLKGPAGDLPAFRDAVTRWLEETVTQEPEPA